MHQLLHPANWKPASGYANGILAEGRTIHVGGQFGWTGDQVFVAVDFVGQTEQAINNIVAIIAVAVAQPEHIVRLTWYVLDKREYLGCLKELGGAYRRVMGRHFPAMTLVQVGALVEDQAKVEIEATAVLP